MNCTALVRVSLPKNLTELVGNSTLRTGAFAGCTALVDVIFNDSLTKIGAYTFYQCSSLGDIILPDSVSYIDTRAFSDSGLKSIILGDSVEFGSFAFENCASLASINLPREIKNIPQQAFNKCTSLVIDDLNLRYLTGIGADAFKYTKVKKVSNLGSVTTVAAFSNCTELTSVNLPPTCTILGGLSDCTNLTDVIGLEKVKELGNNALSGCTNFKQTINMPNLESLGTNYAFTGSGIERVENLGKVTNIPRCFDKCPNLKFVRFPSSVTTIHSSVFYTSRALETLICESATPPTLSAFNEVNKTFLIYVPDASVTAYKEASGWSGCADRILPLSEYTE